MKKIIMLGVLVFFMMAFSINVHATTNEYNSVNSNYIHNTKTYTVGTGCSSETEGVTCYSGDSFYKLLTKDSNNIKNDPMLVFYKDDIIEFIPDTAKQSSNENRTYSLNKGFIIVDNSWNDITSQYAQVIQSVVSGGKTVYQKIKITSDFPVQLLFKGSGTTGYTTDANDKGQKWSDYVLSFNIGIYNKNAIPITYNYNGGEFYGSATPPTSLHINSYAYMFDLPVVYKEGYVFKEWSVAGINSSNILAFDNNAKQTAIVKGFASWGDYSSSGLIAVNEIYLTSSFSSLSGNNVTITLNANGGKIDGYSSHIYNTTISAESAGYLSGFGISNYIPIKTGSTFDGWYLDQELTQRVTQDSDVYYTARNNQTKTLYAKWVPTVLENSHTITINSGRGFTTDLTSPKTVKKNDDLEITINTNNGYKLTSIKIDNVEQTLPLTNNKIVLTDITKNVEILVVAEEIIYNFDKDSKDVTYTIGTDEELSLRVEDTTIDNFDKVYINDKLLDSKYYTVESGSIIVKVKNSYLKTLKNGTYSIRVLTKDGGQATASFLIANSSVKDELNPKTGDKIMIYLVFSGISLFGILGTKFYTKKKNTL